MASRLRLFTALCLLAVLTVIPAPAGAAVEHVWTITPNSASFYIGPGASATFQLGCPPGEYTPISGGYSGTQDLRRASEKFVFDKGGYYEVRLDNNNTAAGDTVTLSVQCVPTTYFSTFRTVSAVSYTGSLNVHRNFGNVSCGGGEFAFQPTVSFAAGGATVLTTGRSNFKSSWHVEGWHETAGSTMTVTVTCVPESEVPGFYSTTHSDAMSSWSTPTSATCPTGLMPIGGGTIQYGAFTLNGPWGAISILGHVSGSGYSSVAESLDGGTMITQVYCLPSANPTVAVSGVPSPSPNSSSATWTFSATDPAAAGGYSKVYTCTLEHLDAGTTDPTGGCTSPYNTPGLSDGQHQLTVHVTTGDGRQATNSGIVTIDTTPPTVALTKPTARFTLGSRTPVTWVGTDATTGVATYATRYQSAAYNSGFGAWTTPVTDVGSATGRTFGSLVRGRTYCYSTQATDSRGNVSTWATARCTAVPLDERSLNASSGWKKVKRSGYFAHTAMTTKKQGATLSVGGATVKRLAVTALKCPSCGTVGVYFGRKLIKTISLKAAATSRKTIALPTFSLRTGTVKLKVLSSGKPIEIDALGLSRV